MDFTPLWISIKTALLATTITFLFGLYAARWILRLKRWKGVVDGLFTLPLVLPPTAVGFFLLLFLGKNSVIGDVLQSINYSIVFSWEATVVAASIVAFPIMYRTSRGALEQVDPTLISAARTLGVSEERIFWRVMFPLSLPGIVAGVILSFARALGEFGATIMIAGNIPGKTQTMATAIYSAVQAGDDDLAYIWAMVIIMISFIMMVSMNYFTNRQKETSIYLCKK